RARAAVGIADQHAADLVDGDVVEVEQVTAGIAAAAIPDAAALHWIRRCDVRSHPRLAGVVGRRDVEVPDAVEAARLVISGGGSAQEGERSAVVVAGDDLCELGILDPVTGARVERLRPST